MRNKTAWYQSLSPDLILKIMSNRYVNLAVLGRARLTFVHKNARGFSSIAPGKS